MVKGLLIGLVIVFYILTCAACALVEAIEWNGGICKKTGKPWIWFDDDSQGGRGYKSGDCVCWISWPFVDTDKSGLTKHE